MSLTKNKLVKKKPHPIRNAFFLLLLLALLIGGLQTLTNRYLFTNYSSLNKQDRKVLEDLNKICEASEEEPLWTDFSLGSFLLVKGSRQEILDREYYLRGLQAYTIGVTDLEEKWYAKEITMPEEYVLPRICRLSVFTPEAVDTWNPTELNSAGNQGLSFGTANGIYFTKYTGEQAAVDIVEELFAYRMGMQVDTGSRLPYAGDRELQEQQMAVMQELVDLLNVGDATVDEWHIALQHYADIQETYCLMDEPACRKQTREETTAGSCQYVRNRVSAVLGEETMGEILIQEGTRQEYSNAYVGSVLCAVLDRMPIEGWQQRLNEDQSLTLYDLIAEHLSENNQ